METSCELCGFQAKTPHGLRTHVRASHPEVVLPSPGTIEWFVGYVDDSGGPNACHLWTGGLNHDGYGKFMTAPDRRQHRAPRWLLGYLRGKPLSGDEKALHTCDVRRCVNPAHLYIGTQAQNMRDRWDRCPGAREAFERTIAMAHEANRSKTHCRNGHERIDANLHVGPDGTRSCVPCRRERDRRRYAEKKAAA